jgi:hypothetical protein
MAAEVASSAQPILSPEHKSLRMKKYATFLGTAVLVVSNTLLLVGLLVELEYPGIVDISNMFDPYIVGFNLDVILSSLAMLVVSGTLNRLYYLFPWALAARTRKSSTSILRVAPQRRT